MLTAGDAAVVVRIDCSNDGMIEYPDDEAGQIAPPVGDRGARGSLGVDRHADQHAHGADSAPRLVKSCTQRGDRIIVPRAFQRGPPLGSAHIVEPVNAGGLRLGGKEDGIVLVVLRRRHDAAIRTERFDPVAGNAIADRGSLVFGALLAVDPRDPGDAKDARMSLEQPPAESLELAAGDFLVGGLEQGAKRDQPADVFVHAVLHDDRLGLGDALELDLGDPLFPLSDGVGRRPVTAKGRWRPQPAQGGTAPAARQCCAAARSCSPGEYRPDSRSLIPVIRPTRTTATGTAVPPSTELSDMDLG